MYIAYCDESGDDGFPKYSSPLFVFSTCYLHYHNWKDTYSTLHEIRKRFRRLYGLPLKIELHWKKLLTRKRPYREYNLSDPDIQEMVRTYCDELAGLDLEFINICIVKQRIKKGNYSVLDNAFKYCIQRIENTLTTRNSDNRFMIITDPGRVGKMRKISRRIQRINYIPSKFSSDPYRQEIKTLIEDPLPKDSNESHFIQACDFVAYIVYLYRLRETQSGTFHNRLPLFLNQTLDDWLGRLSPSLNLKASRNPYGIVEYPK